MSTEIERQVIGATGQGEVVIITKQHNAVSGAGVEHTKRYSVRQGGHEVLETDDRRRAQSVAKALTGPPAKEEEEA